MTRKKSTQKKIAGNYNLIQGTFELSSDIQSKHRKGPFVFGDHQWGRLTNWIASETLIKPTFDMDQLIKNMFQKKNYNEDTKEITKKLLNEKYNLN